METWGGYQRLLVDGLIGLMLTKLSIPCDFGGILQTSGLIEVMPTFGAGWLPPI
jgi:hypothetical protein